MEAALFDPTLSTTDSVRTTPEYRGADGQSYSLRMRYYFLEKFDLWYPRPEQILVNPRSTNPLVHEFTTERENWLREIAPDRRRRRQ